MRNYFRPPLWVVPLAIAALVALLGWWGNERLRSTVDEELRANLTATLDANVTALEIWITNQARLATSLAEEPTLRALALQALKQGPASQSSDISGYLRSRLDGLGYEIAHLVDTNFVVIATSRRGPLRVDDSISQAHVAKFSELFVSGRPVVITPFRPRHRAVRRVAMDSAGEEAPGSAEGSGDPPTAPGGPAGTAPDAKANRRSETTLMQIATPIRDDQNVVRGALALVINPDREFTRILSVARAGKSGETYVFDQNGLMLSRSRFDGQLRELGLIENQPGASSAAVLRLIDPGRLLKKEDVPSLRHNMGSLIRLVANAVAGGSGVDVEPSRDYRGVSVVGAWRWLPGQSFGLVTQLDADEAFKPLRVLDLLFVMLILLLMLCALGMFLFSLLGAVWRRRLSEAELKLKQLGQYTLEEKIGEGAMGTVYRARHALMRRNTAIKLLLPERADQESIQHFEREVRLTSRLTHPNTIQVYDYGHTSDGIFYYAMELLEGLSLHQLVSQFGVQPEGRVVYILTQVCDALAEAHAVGLVHRDLKPGNIFVCDRGGVPDWVKVLDFGLVRAYREGRRSPTRSGADNRAEGTPLFMPPEAFRDSGISDPRSDIYALGAVAYFLITGQYVFDARSDLELYQMHSADIPIRPSKRAPVSVSAELEETILRCLEKEPNLRVQSVAELRNLLLTSPFAEEWDASARAAWWARYHAQVHEQTAGAPGPSASPDLSVKISFADRVKT